MNQISQLQQNINIDGYPIQAGLTRRVVEDDARGDVPGGGVSAHPPGQADLPLGIYANIGATVEECSGVIPVLSSLDAAKDIDVGIVGNMRLLRFKAQDAIAKYMLPDPQYERIRKCLRTPRGQVEVRYDRATGAACYRGLCTCGSVWACPNCSNKVSQRRHEEIQVAVDKCYAAGGQVLIAALTVSHSASMPLAGTLARFLAALRSLRQYRAYREWSKKLSIVGLIKTLEVTWGAENGWHPHVHTLFFLDKPFTGDMAQLQQELYAIWRKVIALQDLVCDQAHGVKLQEGWKEVSDYLTKCGNIPGKAKKWDIGAEMTKSHAKLARGQGRYVPFDLVRVFMETGDLAARNLFREYVEAFTGKHQIQWSRGLRALYGIEEEKTDEEIAAGEGDIAYAEVLATPSVEQWQAICQRRQRGFVLEVARYGEAEAVQDVIENVYMQWIAAGCPRL